MIDGHKLIQSTLSTILPSQYELFLGPDITLPCISYNEQNNYTIIDSDDTGFSYLDYHIKVFARTVEDMQYYSNLVDLKLKEIGGKRLSSQEVVIEGHLEKWMVYRFIGKEYYR